MFRNSMRRHAPILLSAALAVSVLALPLTTAATPTTEDDLVQGSQAEILTSSDVEFVRLSDPESVQAVPIILGSLEADIRVLGYSWDRSATKDTLTFQVKNLGPAPAAGVRLEKSASILWEFTDNYVATVDHQFWHVNLKSNEAVLVTVTCNHVPGQYCSAVVWSEYGFDPNDNNNTAVKSLDPHP